MQEKDTWIKWHIDGVTIHGCIDSVTSLPSDTLAKWNIDRVKDRHITKLANFAFKEVVPPPVINISTPAIDRLWQGTRTFTKTGWVLGLIDSQCDLSQGYHYWLVKHLLIL